MAPHWKAGRRHKEKVDTILFNYGSDDAHTEYFQEDV